jgi:hypothetical protein
MPLGLTLSKSNNQAIKMTHIKTGEHFYIVPTKLRQGMTTLVVVESGKAMERKFKCLMIDKSEVVWPGVKK